MPRMPGADASYDALLGQIYDAALVPDGWSGAVAALTAAFGGLGGSLLFQDRTRAMLDTDITAISGYPDHAAALYTGHFAGQDQRIGLILAAAPGHVMADEWGFDYGSYLKTSIYNEFYRPFGLARAIGVRLFSEGSRIGVLSAFREPGRAPYRAEDIRLMERLSPHVMRALQLKRQLDRADMVSQGLASGLDRFPQAVLLLDPGGAVAEMNAAADRLLAMPGCPLHLRGGQLHATQPAGAGALRQALHDASRPAASPSGPPAVVRLCSRDGAMVLSLMAVPVRRADRLGPGRARGTLVFIAGFGEAGVEPVILARQYGLTRAESLVAAALLAGEAAAEIADRRGVGLATVRTQIKTVLAKAGVTSQGRLSALVSRGLGVLRDL